MSYDPAIFAMQDLGGFGEFASIFGGLAKTGMSTWKAASPSTYKKDGGYANAGIGAVNGIGKMIPQQVVLLI